MINAEKLAYCSNSMGQNERAYVRFRNGMQVIVVKYPEDRYGLAMGVMDIINEKVTVFDSVEAINEELARLDGDAHRKKCRIIAIRFGTWSHAGMKHFLYWRIYWRGRWTPFCRMEWRYRATTTKDRIFVTYENLFMATWLGRFRLARWGSDKLYSILFK